MNVTKSTFLLKKGERHFASPPDFQLTLHPIRFGHKLLIHKLADMPYLLVSD